MRSQSGNSPKVPSGAEFTPTSTAPLLEFGQHNTAQSVAAAGECLGKGDVKAEVTIQRSLAICIFNVFCGTAMVITNKYVLQVLPASNAWLAFQDIITVGVVLVMHHFKWIEARLGKPTPALIKISLLYTLNVGSSLFALGHLTVPMYSVLKRITILIVFAAEYFMLHKTDVLQCAPAIGLIVGSTILAGAFDLDFTFLGYSFAMLSCLTQGFSYILSKKYHDSDKQHSVWDVVFHTSLLGPLLLLPVVVVHGEIQVVMNVDWSTLWYNPWLITNTVIVIAFQFSQWLNCNVNSPLTLAVTNQVKAALLSLFGLLFFPRPTSLQTVAGIVLNIVGGCWYAHTKYKMYSASTKSQKSDAAL